MTDLSDITYLSDITWHLEMLRDRNLCPREFRKEMYKVSRNMAEAISYYGSSGLVLVPILRAGLGMLEGVQSVLTRSEVGFLAIKRLEGSTLDHHLYYEAIPDLTDKTAIILDPMLATGGSAIIAARKLKSAGAKSIVMLCICAAPEGLNHLTVAVPDVTVLTLSVDDGLDEDAYIVPGLGDAGDRLYGRVE